jgi:GTP-binding protein Era
MNKTVRARGVIALLGYPNVGKSTLLNRLAGKKIAAITHKPQTTRSVLYHKVGAIVFIDTPGLFAPDVSRALYQSAWGAVQDADIILLLSDGKQTAEVSVLEKLKHWEKPIAIGLNKIDIAREEKVFAQTDRWRKILPRAEIFQISAKRGTGLDYLQQELLKHLPQEREISIAPLDDFHQTQEITREKVLLHMHQELPWQARIKTIKITKQKNAFRVEQTIYVLEKRHRAIFIGRGGDKLKAIGQSARQDMMDYFHQRVHLFITVEVGKDGVA